MESFDVRPRVTERDADQRRPRVDRDVEQLGALVDHPRHEPDPERHRRARLDDRQLGRDALLGVGLLDPDHAEGAGLADGAGEAPACLGRHRRADQRHLDAEQLGQRSGDHRFPRRSTHTFTLDTR